jgi:hypothetical protein
MRPTLSLLLLGAAAAGCRGEPTVVTVAPEPPRAAPAGVPPPAATTPPSTLPFGATSAQPGDEASNDNRGCSRRRNTGALTTCERSLGSFGAWSPTQQELVDAMKVADAICYCATDVHVPAQTCAGRLSATTVKLQVGKQDDPTDCTITITAAEHKGRRWVVIDAFNRDVATFYSILSIVERTAGGFRRYYQGFNGLPDEKSLREGAEGISPEMKRDWPGLPRALRAAFGERAP